MPSAPRSIAEPASDGARERGSGPRSAEASQEERGHGRQEQQSHQRVGADQEPEGPGVLTALDVTVAAGGDPSGPQAVTDHGEEPGGGNGDQQDRPAPFEGTDPEPVEQGGDAGQR